MVVTRFYQVFEDEVQNEPKEEPKEPFAKKLVSKRKRLTKRRPFDLDPILRIFNKAKASAEYQTLLAYKVTPPIAPNFEEVQNLLDWARIFRRWKDQILELIVVKNLQAEVDQSGLPPIDLQQLTKNLVSEVKRSKLYSSYASLVAKKNRVKFNHKDVRKCNKTQIENRIQDWKEEMEKFIKTFRKVEKVEPNPNS